MTITINITKLNSPDAWAAFRRYIKGEALTDAEWLLLKKEKCIKRIPKKRQPGQ